MATPLKYKFDKELLRSFSQKVHDAGYTIDGDAFQNSTQILLEPLELKDRVNVIADQLNIYLEGDYKSKLKILVGILGPENKGSYGTFNDFFWTWPIGAFIERYGQDEEQVSLNAIVELTKRGTGEFAIRPFIRKNPDHLLEVMTEWSKDSNFHVRRLSSEGLRPNLPWASKLKLFIEDPRPVFSILENLKNDPIRYVQTSVANHINDYFKVNNKEALELINSWAESPEMHTKWIIKHAIRNYRKKGVSWAIEMTDKMNKSE